MPTTTERKPTVLVVDDTPFNLQTVSNVLRGRYQVRAAVDGPKALALLARAPDVDLILLDIMMPGMDGFEVCRRIKADPLTMRIPVIFVSALQAPDDESRAKAAGGVDFVRKPIEPDDLLRRVKKHLPG